MTSQQHDIVSEYVKEDDHFLVNHFDPDLMTVKIKLPSLVEWYAQFLGYTPTWEEAITYVDGYGLHAEDQVFRYQEIPVRLKGLNSIIRKKKGLKKNVVVTLWDIYNELDENRTLYSEELEFIRKDVKRRYHGYWCFINGKPTYIDGWHFCYLNYWDIANHKRPDGLPEYRDVDRRLFLFSRYCYTTTEAYYQFKLTYRDLGQIKEEYFATVDAARTRKEKLESAGMPCILDGEGLSDDPHPGFIVDMGKRTVYGYAHPKRRRRGATSAAACIAYFVTTEQRLRHCGLQSLNDDMATKDVYLDKIIRPWRKLPFWHKPAHEGSNAPKERLLFQFPAERTNLSASIERDGHDGWIEPRAANERAFDGLMLHVIIRDEGGKVDGYNYDLMDWWGITKKCLAQGFNIHGLGIIPSTVGEMDSGGGKQYERLIQMSKFDHRDGNGETGTGLLTIMEASYDGLDGHIDRYGNSIIEDPPSPVLTCDGTWVTKGAKTVLENKREMLLRIGNQEDYITELRDFPFTLREAMTKGSRNSGIDIKILRKRASEIRFSASPNNFIKPRRGNFVWVSDFGKDVEWINDPDGKFSITQFPRPEMRNRQVYDTDQNTWMPDPSCCNKFVFGADPFAFNAPDVRGTKKSNGAITAFRHRDYVDDPEDKPRSTWSSEKFVLTYSVRVEDKDEYVEDILKACIYYSSFVYPEMNVAIVAEKLREWGYKGYLLHDTDEWGVKLPMPGRKVSSNGGTKNEIFSDIMTHVRNYGEYENHLELIEEWMNIGGPEEMTDYDLFAASGMCFLGRKSQFPTLFSSQGTLSNIDDTPFDEFIR